MAKKKQVRDPELGRLLSGRDEPSVLEKEALFENVFSDVQPKKQRWSFNPWVAPAMVLAPMAVLLFLVVWPPQDEFTTKGDAKPELRPHCVTAGAPSPCQPGAKLLFEVEAEIEQPYFAAFAQRPDGAVVWYIPDPGQLSVRAPTDKPTILERGFVLGDDHPKGHYDVYGVFTADALNREQLKAAVGEDLRGGDDATVVQREITVETPKP